MTFVSDLEPKILWRYFDKILTIPRGSKNEDQMRQYVISEAEKHGLDYIKDDIGNVVVRKPASAGHENAAGIVIQAHLDMVNEKNSDVEFDFDKDALIPQLDGDFLSAKGTTLGSDNGIGVAAMLAIMSDTSLEHGPLEFLFTIDEETGLTGAQELGDNLLQGRQLLNLDTEEENSLCIGCAGGGDTRITVPVNRMAKPAGAVGLECKLTGLKGGHSGCEIHMQKGNAVKLMVRALYACSEEMKFNIVDIAGGDKHNAIPREAFATVVIDAAAKDNFISKIKAQMAAIAEEYKSVEPDFTFKVLDTEVSENVLDDASSQMLLNFAQAMPHGVIAMNYHIPGLVDTSTNFAKMTLNEDSIYVLMSSRSAFDSGMNAIRERIHAVAGLVGGKLEESDAYPGWEPNIDSRLLKVMKELYTKETGKEPEVGAIHAGLECGIIGAKYDGMDMISFGPQIDFPHSPDERVKIDTVDVFYKMLLKSLKALA
ncbi:MAG: aminoacyl-histidine dipeptidase [Calditrichaeota bacterium]|nr:MAG: aminoacyl-histidine dipeptidase [Calditrichota bacterium]